MAKMDTTKLAGTIQAYMIKKFQEMGDREFKTPLANASFAETAELVSNNGTFASFRVWQEFDVSHTSATNHSPKEYGENDEPSAAMELSDTVFQAGLSELAGFVSLGHIARATDPVNLTMKSQERFATWLRRELHRLVNTRFVRVFPTAVTNLDSQFVEAPKPFKTIFAGGVTNFANLRADGFIQMADIFRAAAILRNSKAPTIKNDQYVCVIDNAGIEQLKLGDANFRDLIKCSEDKSGSVFGAGKMISYGGVYFVPQNDQYACALAAEGGTLANRQDGGKVHVAHVLGRGAFGYLDFGKAGTVQRRSLTPTFKTQDITVTGVNMTMALRMQAQAMTLNRDFGLNLAFTTEFDEDFASLPDDQA